MADLPTNYYDDILSASMNGKKKFRLTYRNGTTEEVTIEDISEYDQYGSKFGAGDINKTNQAVNEKFDSDDVVDPMLTTERGFAADAFLTGKELKEQKESLTASNGVLFKFGINENGEYGHIVTDSEGADTFVPFKKKGYYKSLNGVVRRTVPGYGSSSTTVTFDEPFENTPKVGIYYTNLAPTDGSDRTAYEVRSYGVNVTQNGFSVTHLDSSRDGCIFDMYWVATDFKS